MAPLTQLLCKNNFTWDEVVERTFTELKATVTTPQVLRLPDFAQSFTIYCDASSRDIEVVLIQESQPITYLTKALKGRAPYLTTYD